MMGRGGRRLLSTTSRMAAAWQDSFSQGHLDIAKFGGRKPTHIVIGAGSAGCVLANRLSEDPSNRVLLLEAGPRDHWWEWRIRMPAALMYNLSGTRYNWYYHTTAQEGLNGRALYWPRGRVWGGSSSLNAMCYVRGHAFDYDRWKEEGASGWDFASCLPYFRRAESYNHSSTETDDAFRGRSGPLSVMRGPATHPLHQAFLEAGKLHPLGTTTDMNAWKQEGIGYMDMTIRDGERCSASSAYLQPVLDRPNLATSSGIFVTRILFDRNNAIGVEFIRKLNFYGTDNIDSYSREKMYCESDVILSGGAINSPQLLMASGVGPGHHLRSLEIPVVADLPGVGSNLQDHLEVYVQQRCSRPITLFGQLWPHRMVAAGLEWFAKRSGVCATSHLETGGFARSQPQLLHPDIQLHFLPSTVHDDGRKNGSCHAYQVHVGTMRPKSRGDVRLSSRDPRRYPVINPRYLSHPDDLVDFRACIRLARELFATAAFDDFRLDELAPGVQKESNEELDEFVRASAASAYHPSCSARMGRSDDPAAVVDPLSMQVYGLQGLRVVDASVMPSMVSGNLNAPTIMLAERAADLILGKKPLAPQPEPVFIHKNTPIFLTMALDNPQSRCNSSP